MQIQSMFKQDINREINGVIKVAQDDDASLRQELGEYIITKELRKHFDTFFENYSKAIDSPTDKIGVWISGFFGSGKSHFLKMLSYLLSNREVDGKGAVEIFKDKLDDPLMYATVVRCTSIPTESILFNIDIEGFVEKDKTAVLRVFAKVFYNHLGFYGDSLKIARLERFIDKQEKTQEFRETFECINGASWQDARSSYDFFEDDIVECLVSVLGMSEISARNWFDGEEESELSIKQLVKEIKEYVDSKGKDFRLLFCVDEVGQYIGEDGDLMMNLQSIVEEVGDKCRGKVWVMVTSQEAIDSVVKISGDDFSKIQGRFNTRLSLSSSSVDEVIKKRVLAKTKDADMLLRSVYEKEHAVLKNLYTFNDAVLDLKGYKDAGDFSATYPFVPYQFIIIQKVLAEIRKHGNAGKHLSGGERSMLSGFQEATQKIQDKDEDALVPFYQFYDTVNTFLESTIRQVINRCQEAADNDNGIKQEDVAVLKLLYLVRYIDDIKANIDNIAVLMIDDVKTDKISLRQSITESLERLENQNYVARNGDTYSFLTDEEQDIAIDIRNTSIDSAGIVQSIAQTIFNDIYPSKKYKYGKYDFDFDTYVDNTLIGTAGGGVKLRIITVASDLHEASALKLQSDSSANEAIIVLSEEAPYFEELEQAAKIRKYIKQKNVSQLPEGIQDIIRKRQTQARLLEDGAKTKIERAIVQAACYINGATLQITAGSAKEKLDTALEKLVNSVYSKLSYVNVYKESDADLLTILNSPPETDEMFGTGANNSDAINDISQWLEVQANNHVPVSMGDVQKRYQGIPYGWREIDIAALMARMIVSQKISIKYGGALVGIDDKNLVKYLRSKSEVDKASVTRRIAPSEELMKQAVSFLRSYVSQMSIPEDEDGLILFITDTLNDKYERYKNLLEHEYNHEAYPEKDIVIAARELMADILSQRRDNVALLTRLMQKQDELLDSKEDMEDIETFFKSQKELFDAAQKLLSSLSNEFDYFATDSDTSDKLEEIATILSLQKPYSRIKELSELMQAMRVAYGKLLVDKKEEVKNIITQCMGDIHTLAGIRGPAGAEVKRADEHFTKKKQEAAEAESLTVLDAMITQLINFTKTVQQRIESVLAEATSQPGKDETPQTQKKIVTVRRYDIFPQKRLESSEDIEYYIVDIKDKLYEALENNDGVQLN